MLIASLVQQLLRRLPAVKSVIAGDEFEARVITRENQTPIETTFGRAQAYAMQVAEGAAHLGWIEMSTPPDQVDTVIADCAQLGLFLADVNVSGPRVQMFWIHGKEDTHWQFTRWLGRRFAEGSNAGKSGLKRMRALKLAGLSPGTAGGAVVKADAYATEEYGHIVHNFDTPVGNLRVCEVECPHDANDNDGLVTERGYKVLAEMCGLGPIESACTVQTLIVGPTGAIKFAGQILTKEPTGDTARMIANAPEAEIYVGAPGVDRKVDFDGMEALRVNVWRESPQTGLVPADGLQQAPTVLGYLKPATVAHYSNAIINKLSRADQLAVFREKDTNPIPADDETPMARAASLLLAQLNRLYEARAARNTADAAWEANGSGFAHPNPNSRTGRIAYALRSYVDNNRRGNEGMPAMWIPGHWVKLMSSMFVGDSLTTVKQPRRGWARLVWRNESQPSGLAINNADFGTVNWAYRSDGSDFDDKLTVSLCVDGEANPWLLVLRRPSSPYGGLLLRITREQAAEYEQRTGIPAMPLREGWQEFDSMCRAYAERPDAIDLGAKMEPIPCTNEMADQLAAAKRQAEQVGWTGKVSYLVGALYLSGHSQDGSSKFVTSDLIDNAVEGHHDGQHVYLKFLDHAADLARRNMPFFRPSVEVIEKSIQERLGEVQGQHVPIRYAPNDEFSQVWQLLLKQSGWTWSQHQLLMNRCNGPYQWLTRELSENVTGHARHAVAQARHLWSAWGRSRSAIPYGPNREESIAVITGRTVAEIHKVVTESYSAASAEPYYQPGSFAAALKQAQAVEAKYWQKFDRKLNPKRYALVDALPRNELIAFFDRGEQPPADPTWFVRTWPVQNAGLEPWDEVEVRYWNGRYCLFREGDDEEAQPIAQLGPEAGGIVGLYSEFLGFIPHEDNQPPVAAYRNSARELEKLTLERVAKAQDALAAMRVFAKG